jgi:hypothetical protein
MPAFGTLFWVYSYTLFSQSLFVNSTVVNSVVNSENVASKMDSCTAETSSLQATILQGNCLRYYNTGEERLQQQRKELQQKGPGGAWEEKEPEEDNWAVILCTSRYWHNYRHSSNALAIHRILRSHGYPEERSGPSATLSISDNRSLLPTRNEDFHH